MPPLDRIVIEMVIDGDLKREMTKRDLIEYLTADIGGFVSQHGPIQRMLVEPTGYPDEPEGEPPVDDEPPKRRAPRRRRATA